MYIEIAGAIASGKTTLLNSLLGTRVRAVLEDHRVNPFWEAFYSDPKRFAFETEIAFLLQHYHFAKTALEPLREPVCLDHSFESDLAYCRVGLSGDRAAIAQSIYREIRAELGTPVAVIQLVCSPETLIRRIRARGRPIEQNIELEFVRALNDCLAQVLSEHQAGLRIITLDSESTDFREPGDWLTTLVADLGLEGLGRNDPR